MNTEARLKTEMAIRVHNFVRANPFGEPLADAVVAKYEEKVARAQTLIAQQENGYLAASASRTKRTEIREQVRSEPLRHLTEITKAVALEKPELAKLFRLFVKNPNEQEFRAGVQGFILRITEHRELFAQYGMRVTLIEELEALLAAYDRAVSDADAGRRAHTGARAELKKLTSALVKMTHQLNGTMPYRIRQNPDLGGAWESARNIAWPVAKDTDGPAAGGKEFAA